jgi:hypothetical protein
MIGSTINKKHYKKGILIFTYVLMSTNMLLFRIVICRVEDPSQEV